MLYQWHEFNRALLNPMVSWSQTAAKMFSAPDSWLSNLPGAPRIAANYELAYRLVKDYEKPTIQHPFRAGVRNGNSHCGKSRTARNLFATCCISSAMRTIRRS